MNAPDASPPHTFQGPGFDPDDVDLSMLERVLPLFSTFFGPGRYFDVRVKGWDNLPDPPVMLASNHSGGTTILDGIGFTVAWTAHFGASRPLHALVHDMVFQIPRLGQAIARTGALRASTSNARRVLQAYERDVLVMPGGDLDVWRPSRHAYKVDFHGRYGYARVACERNVPVVPLAHIGAHNTLWVLTTGQRFARLVGIPKVARATVFPVHLSLPFGLTIGPWPHIPPPARLHYTLGEPLWPADFGDPDDPDTAVRLDEAVRAAIQSMLDDMRRERQASPRAKARLLREQVASTARALKEITPSPSDVAFMRGLLTRLSSLRPRPPRGGDL